MAMVHNLLVPLQNMDEEHFWENRPISVMPEPKRSKRDVTLSIKKKVKRNRTVFTTKQLRSLELLFSENKYITSEHRRKISQALNLGDKSVKTWFQNRRMKEKRESLDSSRVESIYNADTSASSENSPHSVNSTDSQEIPQNGGSVYENFTAESYRYQVPYFYDYNTNEQQIQNVHANDYNTMQANGMQFYNANNMYPTQYYPYNDCNNTDNFNYYQFQQENFMQNNYCSSNNSASCFYNDGA